MLPQHLRMGRPSRGDAESVCYDCATSRCGRYVCGAGGPSVVCSESIEQGGYWQTDSLRNQRASWTQLRT